MSINNWNLFSSRKEACRRVLCWPNDTMMIVISNHVPGNMKIIFSVKLCYAELAPSDLLSKFSTNQSTQNAIV